MQLAVTRALAVGWLLTCLVESLSGSPQWPYWNLPQIGVGVNNYPADMRNSFALGIDHGRKYRGSSNSPYESIDKFQIEQQNQPQNPGHGTGHSQLQYDYEDEYSNQFRKDEESYYQSLLRVTENPLRELQNHETFVVKEPQSYNYQDYLPLDENESFDAKQYNPEKKQGKVNPSKNLNGNNENVENSEDQKIAKLMTNLLTKEDSYTPSLNDLDTLNSLEDEMIAEATVPDEIKREIRQVRGQQPGILWTLARLAFDQVNDTKSAVNQFGSIINNNFAPEEPPTSPPTTTTTTTDPSADLTANGTTTTTTTTEAPFRLTRTNLQGIIRRNLKGLIRLFNIEWRDALNQSQISRTEFQRDLGNQIRPYLEPNPSVKFN